MAVAKWFQTGSVVFLHQLLLLELGLGFSDYHRF